MVMSEEYIVGRKSKAAGYSKKTFRYEGRLRQVGCRWLPLGKRRYNIFPALRLYYITVM